MRIHRLVFSFLLVAACGWLSKSAESAPPFSISKKTTAISKPRDANGYVNYLKALDFRYSKGVTSGNNAAVLLLQAIGRNDPESVPDANWKAVLRRLKLSPSEWKGPFFISVSEWHRQHGKLNNADTRVADRHIWKSSRSPEFAKWLKANEKPLQIAIEASRRSRFFIPVMNDPSREEQNLILAEVPCIWEIRHLATTLPMRAMNLAGDGKTNESWKTLMACRRLARLLSQGATPQCLMSAARIESQAIAGQLALLKAGSLSRDQLTACLRDLRKLPELTGFIEPLDRHSRYVFLDLGRTLTQGDGEGGKTDRDAAVMSRLDWNLILRNGNEWFDRYVKSARKRNWDDCSKDLKALDSICDQQPDEITQQLVLNELLNGRLPDRKLAENFSNRLLELTIPYVRGFAVAERRAQVKSRLAQIAFALQASHRRLGDFPERLEELCPHELTSVPRDTFSRTALIYRKTDSGYLLYSIGANGVDDGGRSRNEKPRGDDLAIVTGQNRW